MVAGRFALAAPQKTDQRPVDGDPFSQFFIRSIRDIHQKIQLIGKLHDDPSCYLIC